VTGDRILVDFRVNGAPMGSELRSSGDVEVAASAVGEAAIDRIELLRDNRVIATHCHAGTWDAEPGDGKIHAKLRLAVGWGPSDEYGFERTGRRWSGRLRIDGGEIVGARGCFTRLGQRHSRTADNEWEWQLTTSGRGAGAENIQAIVFDLAGAPDSWLTVESDGAGPTNTGATGAGLLSHQVSLADALRTSRVIPLLDEARQAIWDQFGLKPEDIPSPDGVYHNAPKIKLHRAAPEAGYSAALSFTDRPPAGVHWYYLRVSQTNGQMAWTSPVWVEV
jgi:hypothetical protein